jgi:hypothetical protein
MRQLYICRSCRLEKIVNPEYEERFLCGFTPACQMPSLVVAKQA